MDELLQFGAAELAHHIRTGEVSPVDVVEVHIQRIMQVNPRLNAVVTPMFEAARKAAQEAEATRAAQGSAGLPPLFGVPITVKDCWPVAGVRFTGGSWYLRDHIAEETAAPVQRLLDAGAIILGKTNCPDMCWLAETTNPVFGRTNNPHNLRHMAGGSSGGEGAIIAAGGSPLGLGSDIAGSVRIPAAANGCVSLKPTAGRIATGGHVPHTADSIADWNTAGPMARRIEDLALALQALSVTPVKDYHKIKLSGRPCTVYVHNRLFPVRREVSEAVSMAAGTLRSADMDVVRDDSLPMLPAFFAYAALFAKENSRSLREEIGGGETFDTWAEVRANFRGEAHISLKVLYFTQAMNLLGTVSRGMGYGSFQRLERIRERFLNMMQPGGVILCPTLLSPPPRHGWTWKLGTTIPYTVMFNALGFPAVCVPVSITKKGLPLVVQVVAQPHEDETALAVAAELERVYGGWQMAHL